MGFFSNIKNKARQQVSPVMPMAPQPMQELRAGTFMPNSPQVDRRPSPPRIPAPPAVAPDISMLPRIPKTEEEARMFRMPKALPPRRGPMNRGIPGLMNQIQGQPRMMMAVGGPLMGAAGKFARSKAAAQRGTNKYFPDEFGNFPPTGIPSLRATSPLTDSLRRGTENLIIGGTGAGLAIGLDGTQELREPFSKDNLMFISPEAFGRDLAQLRMDVGSVVNLAKNKASEMGEDINDYVSRARSAYDQQMNQDMEDQRMQELDAQQGMQPFSVLTGPNMPLRRPEPTPRQQEVQNIDDILSSLEKKN